MLNIYVDSERLATIRRWILSSECNGTVGELDGYTETDTMGRNNEEIGKT